MKFTTKCRACGAQTLIIRTESGQIILACPDCGANYHVPLSKTRHPQRPIVGYPCPDCRSNMRFGLVNNNPTFTCTHCGKTDKVISYGELAAFQPGIITSPTAPTLDELPDPASRFATSALHETIELVLSAWVQPHTLEIRQRSPHSKLYIWQRTDGLYFFVCADLPSDLITAYEQRYHLHRSAVYDGTRWEYQTGPLHNAN